MSLSLIFILVSFGATIADEMMFYDDDTNTNKCKVVTITHMA
jgi:hypothetical protein